ncbi:MAG: hypothetical protein U1F49_14050 [Rubrivivax sp.]
MQGAACIVASRQSGLYLACPPGADSEERQQGNLASNLAGAGSRWSGANCASPTKRLDPATPMPAYHRSEELHVRVGAAWKGKPVLDAQQVENVGVLADA